jgi:hypothetical protein
MADLLGSTGDSAPDEGCAAAGEQPLAIDQQHPHVTDCMALILMFLLGVGNFAMHKAVLESRHPLLGHVPWFVHLLGGRVSLAAEFLLLLAALLLVAYGSTNWGWGYLGYSLLNGVAAWLILSRRI